MTRIWARASASRCEDLQARAAFSLRFVLLERQKLGSRTPTRKHIRNHAFWIRFTTGYEQVSKPVFLRRHWHMSGTFLAYVWHMSGTCVARVSHTFGTRAAHAWHICGTCVAHVWHMCGTCVAHVWHMCGTRIAWVLARIWHAAHKRREASCNGCHENDDSAAF